MVETSFRTKLVSLIALLVAIWFGLKEQIYQYYEYCTTLAATVVNLRIAGWYIPWKYITVCIFLASLFAYYKIRKWVRANVSPSKSVADDDPVMVSGKTLLEIHTSSQNIKELSRRLDNVEKTTHLVMKQLEAVTKCMTEVLREGKVRTLNNNHNASFAPETHL